MATVLRSKLGDILLACQRRLVAVLRWPEERVLLMDPDELELPPPQGDQVACLWLDGEAVEMPAFEGAGRHDTREACRLVVAVYTRCAGDEKGSARKWLTDRALGHIAARRAVLDALVAFQPVDKEANWLAVAPMVPGSASRPKRDRKTAGWGESRLGFTVVYELDLNQDYQ